jgi:tRNA dimethylallyltransferase
VKPFFIVGPTATGKSEIAAEIASQLDAEVVSVDVFQIYRGLDLLTAKPEEAILRKVPHHLLSVVPLSEEMNVEKFRTAAAKTIEAIHAHKKRAIVVGGSGLYIKALTHGLSRLPQADPKLRARLDELTLNELRDQLVVLDPAGAEKVDLKNRRRVSRALEICLLTGKPFSELRTRDSRPDTRNGQSSSVGQDGVLLFRNRAELYERIDRRVENMFAQGVVEEVRALRDLSSTAQKALGLHEIRALLAGEISEKDCVTSIQQATRRYAKRQLTWFRGQPNFEPLNISSYGYPEATNLIAQKAGFTFAQNDD